MPYQPFGTKVLKKLNEKRKKPRKRGPLMQAEKLIVGEIVKDAPANMVDDRQIEDLARLLRRNPDTIRSAVVDARTRLQTSSDFYVQAHAQATLQALASGDPDVARKAAEWAMTNISSRDKDGKTERIIEQTTQADTQPKIMIGINLGGLGQLPSRAGV